MDTLTDRLSEAEECRNQFFQTLKEVRTKLTAAQLTAEAVSFLAKGLDMPGQVKTAAKENPFFTSVVLAFLAYILSGAFEARRRKNRSPMAPSDNDERRI